MRIFFYVVAGLLAVALVLSLFLNRWDVLIGVAAGLTWVIAELLVGWRGGREDPAPKWLNLATNNATGQTTYYYDEDDTKAAASADDVGADPNRNTGEDEGTQQR